MTQKYTWSVGALLALFLLSMGFSPTGDSTLETMAHDADAIYVGKILLSRSSRDEDGMIRTRTVLRVGERFKGTAQAGERITIVTPGGEIEGEIASVPGAPNLQKDDQVLLFLNGEAQKNYNILGLYEGCYSIYNPTRSNDPMVIGFDLIDGELEPSSAQPLKETRRALSSAVN